MTQCAASTPFWDAAKTAAPNTMIAHLKTRTVPRSLCCFRRRFQIPQTPTLAPMRSVISRDVGTYIAHAFQLTNPRNCANCRGSQRDASVVNGLGGWLTEFPPLIPLMLRRRREYQFLNSPCSDRTAPGWGAAPKTRSSRGGSATRLPVDKPGNQCRHK